MTDPLTPALASFVITAAESSAVTAALAHTKPWKHDAKELAAFTHILKSLKDRIRDFHMKRQNSMCCYCRMSLHGGGPFIIDREHIVPKKQYKSLTYVISNLSVACKRCNMQIKKDKLNFLVDQHSIELNHTQSHQYRFIHPNFDNYSDFIDLMSARVNGSMFLKYTKSGHPKADYTYTYFQLNELEINSFDAGQGIAPLDSTMKARLEFAITQQRP